MANSYRSSAMLGALVLASTAPARADRTITLDDAIALARTHNRDLRAARERVAEANAGVEQARAALLPTVAAQGKYTHNYREVDFNALLVPTFGIADAIRATTTVPAEAAAIGNVEAGARAALAGQPVVVITKQEELDGQVSATV